MAEYHEVEKVVGKRVRGKQVDLYFFFNKMVSLDFIVTIFVLFFLFFSF